MSEWLHRPAGSAWAMDLGDASSTDAEADAHAPECSGTMTRQAASAVGANLLRSCRRAGLVQPRVRRPVSRSDGAPVRRGRQVWKEILQRVEGLIAATLVGVPLWAMLCLLAARNPRDRHARRAGVVGLAIFAVVATRTDARDEAADAAWQEGRAGSASGLGPGQCWNGIRPPCRDRRRRRRTGRRPRDESRRASNRETPARGRATEMSPVDRASLEARLLAEGLTASAWSNLPGERYEQHVHDYDKVVVAVEGSITFGLVGYGVGFVLAAGRTARSAGPRPARRGRRSEGRHLPGGPSPGRIARHQGPRSRLPLVARPNRPAGRCVAVAVSFPVEFRGDRLG